MSFTAVGSSIQQFSTSSFSLTPVGVGHLILLSVNNKSNGTVTATALSSSNVTWAQMGSAFQGSVNGQTAVVFAGKVTSTSAATVTITWSGTTPGSYQATGSEFSVTSGSWAFDTQGHIDGGGTNTWASLTPAGSGELYFGASFDSGTATAGSTPGFTYISDAHGNGLGWAVSVSAAYAPVWGDASHDFGVMILVRETGAAAVPAPVSLVAVNRPALIVSNSGWRGAGHSR